MNKKYFNCIAVIIFCLTIICCVSTPKEEIKGELYLQLGHSSEITTFDYSPDGLYFVTGSDDFTVKLWNVKSGKEIWTFDGFENEIETVKFNPDGLTVAACSSDYTVRIINAEDGKEMICIENDYLPSDIVFNSTGTKLYFTSYSYYDEEFVVVYNPATGNLIQKININHSDYIRKLALSRDDRYLLVGTSSGQVYKINAITRKVENCINAGNDIVRTLCFNNEGSKFCTGTQDGNIKLWNTEDCSLQSVFENEKNQIVCDAVFSKDDKIVNVRNSFGTIMEYDCSTNKLNKKKELGLWGNSIKYSPTYSSIVIDSNFPRNDIEILNSETWELENVIHGFRNSCNTMDYNEQANILAIGMSNGDVCIWNTLTGTELLCIQTGSYKKAVALNSTGSLVYIETSKEKENFITAYNTKTGKEEFNKQIDCNNLDGIVISEDGNLLAMYNGKAINILNLLTNEFVFKDNAIKISSLSFSPDSSFIALGCDDKSVKFLNLKTFKYEKIVGENINKMYSLESIIFSKNEKTIYLLDCVGNFVEYDLLNKKEISYEDLEKSFNIESVAWRNLNSNSSKSKISASNHNYDIYIFSPEEKDENLIQLKGHNSFISTMFFSNNETKLFSASEDGTVKIWDTKTGKCLVTLLHIKGDDWISWTEDGCLAGTEKALKKVVCYKDGRNVVPINKISKEWYKPEVIAKELNFEEVTK